MRYEKKMIFILVTIFLDTIGVGLLVPLFPQLIHRFSTNPQLISEYFGWFVGSYALMQFIASPILGALSDRYGRKVVLLASLMGATLDYIFMAYAPNIQWLMVGRILAGLTGASMTVATSYVVDISAEEDRPHNFGLIGAAWGLGFIAGPVLGASLGSLGIKIPFFTAAGLNLLIFFFGLFILPESLPPERRRAVTFKNLNPLQSIFNSLMRSKISVLVWMYFLIFLAGQSLAVNWYLYTEIKFHWTALQLGISLSFIGIVVAISQGLLTRLIIPKIGEEASVTFGIVFYAISFFMFGLSSQSWMLYATILVFGLTGVAVPSLQSLMTKQTPSDKQGELQGSLVSLENLASVIAPAFFTPLFIHFTHPDSDYFFPGVVFIVAAGISILTLGLWMIRKKNKGPESGPTT